MRIATLFFEQRESVFYGMRRGIFQYLLRYNISEKINPSSWNVGHKWDDTEKAPLQWLTLVGESNVTGYVAVKQEECRQW